MWQFDWTGCVLKAVTHQVLLQGSVINNNIGRGMTNFINETEISALCDRAAQLPNLQTVLTHSQKKYQTNLAQETPTSILELAQKVNEREVRREGTERGKGTPLEFWAFGERKIFCWAVMLYSHLNQVSIQSMEQRHFLVLQAIFQQKSIEFINYEVTAIARSGNKVKEPWSEQQILLLTRIVAQTSEKQDWRAVSFLLFVETKCGSFKALQECREKWCNYLNPQLNKESWSLEEDYQLFELVEREGCRWALISRRLRLKRTEHMVKNRYNAYMRNWKNKRSNVKTKKGLTSRILSYLRTRLNKKLKRQEPMQERDQVDTPYPPTPEPEHHNEYSEYPESEELSIEESEAVLQPRMEVTAARQAYIEEKKEKNTADCEVPIASGNVQVPSVQEEGRSFNLQLMMNSFDGLQFKSGKEEMRLIEDEVVRALGCSHFERTLEPYQYDVYEDCDSLSWLI